MATLGPAEALRKLFTLANVLVVYRNAARSNSRFSELLQGSAMSPITREERLERRIQDLYANDPQFA
ncbi:hypothetical protein, partial [Mycobacterium marinum]|uniref:hypothetical protein n=1 Tax=Mycobacterium marinum TaxID=1781 RepID=UPI00356950C2